MNKTALIYTKDEASTMPPDKRPICYRITSKMYVSIFESIGAASLCWEPKPTGVFDSNKASKFALDACFSVAEELERLGITFDQLQDSACSTEVTA